MTARIVGWSFVLTLAALTAIPTQAQEKEKERDAAAILKDFHNLYYADIDQSRLNDPEYIKSYLAAMDANIKGRTKLIPELLKVDPKNELLRKLLIERWWDIDDALANPEFESEFLKAHPEAADRIQAAHHLRDAIGKPFHLEFQDAISGKTIRMADLKGKVVAIDFWSTACGPCNALMPEMKKLYAEYKDQGVEFIGVEINYTEDPERGLATLKDFVAKRQIPWPQFYQPEGFDSEFASSWGINAIPRFFVIDTDGNLVSTTAHGKLETMIPELLSKAHAQHAAATPNAH